MSTRPTTRQAPLALITGASGAIGGTIADLLLDRGWSVIGTYCHAEPATKRVQWRRFDGATGEGTEELQAALDVTPLPLQAVFCCVGAPSSKHSISDTAESEFSDVYAANALSFVRTWHVIRGRARTDHTSVLALSSDAATSSRAGNGPYSAAKAALHALITTLAREEHEHGVRVNAIAPSLIDSPLAEEILSLKGITDRPAYYAGLPWGRPLTTGEVAAVALDVATAPHWRYASGQIFDLAATRSL